MLSHFSCVPLFATLWTVAPRLLCPWGSPGKNTGVGSHTLFQRIIPTQGSNPCLLHLLHWQVGSLPLESPEKPSFVLWVGHSHGVTEANWRNNEKLAVFLVWGIRDRIQGGHGFWKVKREAQKREYQSKGAPDPMCQLFSNLWLTLELHMYETIQLKEKKKKKKELNLDLSCHLPKAAWLLSKLLPATESIKPLWRNTTESRISTSWNIMARTLSQIPLLNIADNNYPLRTVVRLKQDDVSSTVFAKCLAYS